MPFGSLRPSGRIRGLKGIRTAACLIVMIVALTGCGLLPFVNKDETRTPVAPPPQSETLTQNQPQTQTGSAAPPGDALPFESAGSLKGYTQIPAPPPLPPAPPPDPLVAAGALQLGPGGTMGSLGVNLEEYFDDTAEIPDRLSKVERTVSAIQRDLRILAPPILRLITVEQDIAALVAQLTQLAQSPSASRAPPGAAPLRLTAGAGGSGASPAITRPAAQPSGGGYKNPAAKGPVTVERLRLGEHADKTRIVLDVSGPASYRYDLDNGEHLLVIELPEAGWSGKQQEQVAKSPVLASWSVYPMDGGGSRVILQLKKNTSVVYESVLKPNGSSYYRIVIDLRK